MVLKPLNAEPAMQATRAPTISVFADCSIPAGLRIGPVQGIFKLGKYVTDRKEVVTKKKVSTVLLWHEIGFIPNDFYLQKFIFLQFYFL